MAFWDDFISREDRHYRFQLGKTLASGLTGFIFGFLATFIVLGLLFFTIAE